MLPRPDKKIPATVMIIGTFEIAAALLGLVLLILAGRLDSGSVATLVLLVVYAAMGAGLWAIQEWARLANVVIHAAAVPYILYTTLFLGESTVFWMVVRLTITAAIVLSMSQRSIRHKFQTVVPKERRTESNR
jgi:uncharacterized membrane protein (DUF2068 family)